MGKDISISKRPGRQCLGSIVLAICLFVAKAEAALIKLELVAVVDVNTFVSLSPTGFYAPVSSLKMGEPFRLDLFFDTDPRYFSTPNFTDPAPTLDNLTGPMQGFQFYRTPGQILGDEGSVSSELLKVGNVLFGSLLSGPRLFEFDFFVNTARWEGSATFYGARSEADEDGAEGILIASIVGRIPSRIVSDNSTTWILFASCMTIMAGLARRRR